MNWISVSVFTAFHVGAVAALFFSTGRASGLSVRPGLLFYIQLDILPVCVRFGLSAIR